MSTSSSKQLINPLPFYSNWSGHPLPDLSLALSAIQRTRPSKPIIYLAGDSSLDNKAWVPSCGAGGEPLPASVPPIYTSFLAPPTPKPDVAFWLNTYLGASATCLNTAVEASLLRDRDGALLLPQDEFIREHIAPQDILIVSVGGNDIALRPSLATVLVLAKLAWLTSRRAIEDGSAWGLAYFRQLFGDQTRRYIERLVEKQKPRAVVVCMIYFPCEGAQPGWAETQLKLLGYNRYPGQLQAAIRTMFEQGTAQIRVEGTQVIPCALFDCLDGKDARDYTARVEPGVHGGRKMAALFYRLLEPVLKAESV